MTNREFIREYIRGGKQYGANGHLGYAEDKLVNYSTVICIIDRENRKAKVNKTKYSVTTSKIQGELRFALHQEGYAIEEYEGEPASAWNYGYLGAWNVTVKDMKRY